MTRRAIVFAILASLAFLSPVLACEGESRNDIIAVALSHNLEIVSVTDKTMDVLLQGLKIDADLDEILLVKFPDDSDLLAGIKSGCLAGHGEYDDEDIMEILNNRASN